MSSLDGDTLDRRPVVKNPAGLGIAIIGSGNIIENAHIPSYQAAGYRIEGIASRNVDHAKAVAERCGLNRVFANFEEAVSDPAVDIVDIAVPPNFQGDIVKLAADHGKHVLAQKPLAPTFEEATEIVQYAADKGITLAVNQNGRYDPSINAARTLIEQGMLGERLHGWLNMFITMPWQDYYKSPKYEHLMMLNMSIHHMDQMRWLFGNPVGIFARTRQIPGQEFFGETIAHYTIEFADGFLVTLVDDGTNGSKDIGITYRFQGSEGFLKGEIGWPKGEHSTLDGEIFGSGEFISPRFTRQWFPDAFSATMGELMSSLEDGRVPSNAGDDHLMTMKLVAAAYRSAETGRLVRLDEIG